MSGLRLILPGLRLSLPGLGPSLRVLRRSLNFGSACLFLGCDLRLCGFLRAALFGRDALGFSLRFSSALFLGQATSFRRGALFCGDCVPRRLQRCSSRDEFRIGRIDRPNVFEQCAGLVEITGIDFSARLQYELVGNH